MLQWLGGFLEKDFEVKNMVRARLVRRKVYTPMGKPDGHTYDLYVGKKCRTRAMGYRVGRSYVRKLNKR